MKIIDRQFVCHFHFVSWSALSFGFHVHLASPNIEVHVPFGFFRLGWQGCWTGVAGRRSIGKVYKP